MGKNKSIRIIYYSVLLIAIASILSQANATPNGWDGEIRISDITGIDLHYPDVAAGSTAGSNEDKEDRNWKIYYRDNLNQPHAYPVPWKPNDGKPETGTEEGITFTDLSTEGEIKIYTISGELVMKYEYKAADMYKWTWDVKTPNGEKLFSGVYIYYIENEKEHKSGKLIIIR